MIVGISNDMALAVILGAVGTITIIMLIYNKNRMTERKGKEFEILSDDLWIESPLIKSEWLSRYIGNGCIINLKLDGLQPSGSFKIRGISSFMKKAYSLNSKLDTFITTSSANAGMAVAYTAMKLNCKCLFILDDTQKQNELLTEFESEYGAEIEFHGKTWNEADEYALNLSNHESNKFCYVPMFDDPSIFDGHSTMIRELAEQYKDGEGGINDNYPDCIICSVGGGGLINGILGGLFQVGWSRNAKIIAAQSENAALFEHGINNSFKPIPIKTISAESTDLGFRAISEKTMNLAEKYEKFNPIKSIIVRDIDVLNISTLFAIKQHILIEPLCGVAIAALYKNKQYFQQFNNICIIVCGGNHIYFNKELLKESIENGVFNDKTTKFKSKHKHTHKYNVDDDEEKKEMEEIDMDQDEINAYDSDTEDM